MREDGRDRLRRGDRNLTTYHPGEGTESRTDIAPVGVPCAGMVVATAGVLGMRVGGSQVT